MGEDVLQERDPLMVERGGWFVSVGELMGISSNPKGSHPVLLQVCILLQVTTFS